MKLSPLTSIILLAVLSGSLLFLGACDPDNAQITFSHQVHIEQEIECTMCHSMEGEQVEIPTMENCAGCHELDDEEIFAGCVECHKEHSVEWTEESPMGHKKLVQAYLPDKWKDVRYDHIANVEDEANCLLCHGSIQESKFSSLENLPSMKTAMQVQEKMGKPVNCEQCHLELSRQNPPASHNYQWKTNHGRLMEFSSKDTCLMCHQEQLCITCHRSEKPKNHTNLWRRKTHGIQAVFDRSKCTTCHRNDECQVCHQAAADPVPPLPFHTPDASCLTCHSPLAGQGPSPRPSQGFLKPMPHRMMMGTSSRTCLECHQL